MRDVVCDRDVELLHLPKGWATSVRNAVLNVIGIVRIAMLVGREALIQEGDVKGARIHQLESELAMLREEQRLNGARMQRIDSYRRPEYAAVERMAILELRAMRGWRSGGHASPTRSRPASPARSTASRPPSSTPRAWRSPRATSCAA